jgi:1-acyl-sn-glycerol-3-phosphate acyltransferase
MPALVSNILPKSELPPGLQLRARMFTALLRCIPRILVKTKVLNVTIVNHEAVPRTGPAIVASNHLSNSDPVIMWGTQLRIAVAIAKAELWQVPIVKQVMTVLGHIPVDRTMPGSGDVRRQGENVLRNGGLLLLYPEGKRSSDGKLLELKDGCAKLALATGAPIVPAAIMGSNTLLPIGASKPNRHAAVTLVYGTPIHPSNFSDNPDAVQLMLDELRRQLLEMLGQHQPTPVS